LRLNPALLQVRIDLAASLIRDKFPQAALDLLNQTPQDQKGTLAILVQRNWAYLGLARMAEARKGVDLALATSRTPDLLLQDAILKVEAKRFPESRQSVHELLGKNPEDLRALRVLVGSYMAQKQERAAIDEVRAHAASHPKSANLQYFLGDLLLQTGDKAGAKQALAAAKAINPNYAPADMSLAQVDLLQSNWKDARQELNTILSAKGENMLARQWLGMLEAAAGDQAAAIADFRQVISSQPNNALVFNNLAYLLAESGNQTEEPLKYAERAVELDPNNPEFEDTLGWVLYRRAVYDLSVKHLEASVSKKPTALRNYHLAMAYKKAGKDERGRAALNIALRIDPTLPEAKVAQEMFQASSGSGRP
jgi:tetratricopeptide (TPR) repeat protein